MIGYAICGSFCTHASTMRQLSLLLAAGEEVQPVMSEVAYATDTRFHEALPFREELASRCGRPVVHTIAEAEPLGPATPLELLIIAPCTGNTLAKMAHGITDTAVTMAAKAHLRTGKPLLIALATNDALSANLDNIARMSMRKNVYFVPLVQDDIEKKPYSLVCDFSRLPEALAAARRGVQLRPFFLF